MLGGNTALQSSSRQNTGRNDRDLSKLRQNAKTIITIDAGISTSQGLLPQASDPTECPCLATGFKSE